MGGRCVRASRSLSFIFVRLLFFYFWSFIEWSSFSVFQLYDCHASSFDRAVLLSSFPPVISSSHMCICYNKIIKKISSYLPILKIKPLHLFQCSVYYYYIWYPLFYFHFKWNKNCVWLLKFIFFSSQNRRLDSWLVCFLILFRISFKNVPWTRSTNIEFI